MKLHHRKLGTVIGVAMAAMAAGTVAASPASAVTVLEPTVGLGGSGAYHITAHCAPVAGVATTLEQISYVIEAGASPFSTSGATSTGTTLTCYAYDKDTEHIYGSVSSATGEAVGIVTVPTNANAALCLKVSAMFTDGGFAHFSNCPF